jgi:hypothetical protein
MHWNLKCQFRVHRNGLLAVGAGILLASAAPHLAHPQEITYRQDPNAAAQTTLLLKDFDPKPMVHVPSHPVPALNFR